jgi:1,4-dihydroxy-2-naphthoyl-CoA hydrolase
VAENTQIPSWPDDLPDPQRAADALNTEEFQGALGSKMGIRWTWVAPDLVAASMPVAGNTQPYGLLHGGASGVLAESVGSVAASMHAGAGRMAVGIELSLSHHRSAREGDVHAEAIPLSLGRTLATYEIRIVDDSERPVCTARLTCLLRDL